MRIAILAAGAGGMYCGSCMRDNTLAAALRRGGQEVRLLPLFTPLRTDETDASEGRVFMGGVNVCLQQISRVLALLPRPLRRLLDSPGLLRRLAGGAAGASPRRLGELTVSILAGEQGRQRAELGTLLTYLRGEFSPDVVSLPNLMFLGLAGPIRRELGCPILCELTGEDLFLDALPAGARRRADELILAAAGEVDRFLATSEYYADHAARRFGLPPERIDVVPMGIDVEGFEPGAITPVARPSSGVEDMDTHSRGRLCHIAPMGIDVEGFEPGAITPVARPPSGVEDMDTHSRGRLCHITPTVAYMARLCPEKGLDLLADAMRIVRRRPGLGEARLVAGGYLPPAQRAWLAELCRRSGPAMECLGELDREGKVRLLHEADVLCVPTRYPEAKGLYVLEGLAAGRPFVGFDHGSFRELARDTGGLVLAPAGDVDALAAVLAELLLDPARRDALGSAGRAAVLARYTSARMAESFLAIAARARR